MGGGGEQKTIEAAKLRRVIAPSVLMWVLLGSAPPLLAQSEPTDQIVATEDAQDPRAHAERELDALHAALERARFDEARARARALLASTRLRARQRNEALELLAVAQIAARDEVAAQATLSELFARDPGHRERLRDPGPSVSARFARARSEAVEPLLPLLGAQAARDVSGRPLVAVELGAGRDAIDAVHVFTRRADGEQTHLVADVGERAVLRFALPAPEGGAEPGRLALWVEARAPSGVVLARAGDAQAPLQFSLPAADGACRVGPPPLRRAWWLWTSVAVTVAGIGISGAIVAR